MVRRRRPAGAPRRSRWAAGVVSIALLAGACGGDSGPDVALDGSPRVPDDEGVLTAVSNERITLDDERTYDVDKHALVFSTYTRAVESLQNRKGQYVQIGTDGDRMEWMAGIAAVVPGDPPTVYYIGHLTEAGARTLIFRDGTVLRRGEGVEVPPEGRVQVTIDARARRAVAVVAR